MWTVYKHTSPSGKIYIGITSKTPEERWGKGRGYGQQTIFRKAIKKYGWDNFEHEILYENIEEEQAKLLEISLIKYYKSNDREFGYNMTSGGDGITNYKHTEESKHKMSETRRGKHHTDETKRKMSESAIGKRMSDEARAKMSNSAKIRLSVPENNPMFGKHLSPESRSKISAAHKGRIPWNKKTNKQSA